MQGLDKKRLALFGSLVVLAGAVYFIGMYYLSQHHYDAAHEALAQRNFQKASFHLGKYLEARPGDLAVQLLAAQTARRHGNFVEAARLLKLCTQPNDSKVALEERLLRLQQGDVAGADEFLAGYVERLDSAEAVLVLEAYIEGNLKALLPSYLKTLIVPGSELRAQVDRMHKAVELWLNTQHRPIDQVQGLVWRFQTNALAHEQDKAWSDIRQAVAMDPEHREARFFLAMFLSQEHPAESAVHLQKLCDRDPDNVKVCLTLAKIRRGLGQSKESGEILDRLLAGNPEHVLLLVERGRIALDLQQADDAERLLRRALQLAPQSPEINHALSSCLRLTGRTKEADYYQEKFEQIERETKQQREKLAQQKKPAPEK